MVASSSPAAVSWLYYANRLYELPLGVVSIAIAAVLVPTIAASRAPWRRQGNRGHAVARLRDRARPRAARRRRLRVAGGSRLRVDCSSAAHSARATPRRSRRRWRRSAPACPATRWRKSSAPSRSPTRTRAPRCWPRSPGSRPRSSDALAAVSQLRPCRRGGGDRAVRLGRRHAARRRPVRSGAGSSSTATRHGACRASWRRPLVMGLAVFGLQCCSRRALDPSGSQLLRLAALALLVATGLAVYLASIAAARRRTPARPARCRAPADLIRSHMSAGLAPSPRVMACGRDIRRRVAAWRSRSGCFPACSRPATCISATISARS